MKYEGSTILTEDLLVRPELQGLQALLMPFLAFTSSQRGEMFASHIVQAVTVDSCEPPRIMTGYESKIGRYEFNQTTRDQDVRIIAVIPKFKANVGSRQIKHNPTLTVIYIGLNDQKINFIDISDYTLLSRGFGYMNKQMNWHELVKDNCIPQDMGFAVAPDHDGDLYMQGINANTVFLPLWATTQDAFIVSQDLADRCEHTAFDSVELSITPDDIPLNKYGDEEDYKIMPDIGEVVGDDGILIGFRNKSKASLLGDITKAALSTPQYLHDSIYSAPIGAQVVDIQVFTNLDLFKAQRGNRDSPHRQLLKYQEQHNDYYNDVINVYKEYKRQGYQLSPAFNTLVTNCIGWSVPKYGPQLKVKLITDKDPIRFMHLRITYAYKRKIAPGFKLAGRQGDKGVISEIWANEDMPIDEQGIRADLIVVPGSNINRMNLGQLHEQFLNRAGTIIQQRLHRGELGNTESAFNYIMNFINDVRPNYAKMIIDSHNTPDLREDYVEAVYQDGIYLVIGGFTESITPEMILRIADKYDIGESPVSWVVRHLDGSIVKHVTSKRPACIGSKYIYLLGKIPLDQLIATEIGYVSQFSTPIKPGERAKNQSFIGQSCIRFGEDETAMLLMSLGGEITARLRGVYSGSPVALDKMQQALLSSPKPTTFHEIPMSTNEIINTDRTVALFTHQMGAIGFAATNQDEQ